MKKPIITSKNLDPESLTDHTLEKVDQNLLIPSGNSENSWRTLTIPMIPANLKYFNTITKIKSFTNK